MKKIIAAVLCGICGLSITACGGADSSKPTTKEETSTASKTETLTGLGEGYGGQVKAVLTVEDGRITKCKLEGADETPEVGGKALEELQRQVVAVNGYEVDGVAGATLTSQGVMKAVADALGEEISEEETIAMIQDGVIVAYNREIIIENAAQPLPLTVTK